MRSLARNLFQALASELAAELATGLDLDQGSLEMILLTLDLQDPAAALAALAAEPDTSDHAPLMALALSPGPGLLHALEPALALAQLNAADAVALGREAAAFVAARLGGRITLLLPDGACAALPASPFAVAELVRRLRPEATAPAELRALLARRLPRDKATSLAASLRHSGLAWSPAREFFLAALLERAQLRDLPDLAAWALGFLKLAGLEFVPHAALARRRQALLDQLRLAEAQEVSLERGCFEVRMSQGLRQGHVHGPDVRAELERLDLACVLVLGVSGQSLSNVAERDLGQARDPAELLRLLREDGPDSG